MTTRTEFGVLIPMKNLLTFTILSVAILLFAGCESDPSVSSGAVREAISEFESFKSYHPTKAVFLPLSEIYIAKKPGEPDTIMAYVALQDYKGSSVKAPAVFRFELYKYQARSIDPAGKRLYIWDDMDLMPFYDNNIYWRDYLRAYEFKFEYECHDCKKYVLEVTCTGPTGSRLITSIILDKNKPLMKRPQSEN